MSRSRLATIVASLCLVSGFSASAAMQHRVEASAFDRIGAPLAPDARVRIEKIPLLDKTASTLVVEPFDILAPDAVIEVFDAEGKGEKVKPEPMRQFRGMVEGDPTSLVYFSVVRGNVQGIVMTRDRKFTLSAAPTDRQRRREGPVTTDVYVEEISAEEEYAVAKGFECGVEGKSILPPRSSGPRIASDSRPGEIAPSAYTWPTTSAMSMITLAVESDSALYAKFGNDATAVQTYLRSLVAATATIYKRDLRADITIGYLGVRTATDPWAVNPGTAGTWDGAGVSWTTTHALLEYGDYWQSSAPSSAKKSAAVLISGQSQTGGIAWTDILCQAPGTITADWGMGAPYTNHAYGPYAYCGGVGLSSAERSVPDPDALTNYGMPSNYWPLLQLSHELGHTVQSSHTHCTTLTASDKLLYGRTFVDNCYSGEVGGDGPCYSGATGLPSDGLDGKGTIMSYCHLLAGSAGVRFIFGRTGESSHQIIDLMRARLDTLTPTGFSAITAPTSVSSGGSGTASVTNTAGLTYAWTITNGTFSGGGTTATGASVNFTGTTNPVTLRVIATNANGCAVTDTKQVTVSAVTVNPPTNVVAAATSSTAVGLTWTAASGASTYQVYRSANGSTWSAVGSPTAAVSFSDTTASSNTAYLYKVRSRDASANESVDSNKDLATTVIFTDPTITANSTAVKPAHITQLRTAVGAVRTLAGLSAASFTDATVSSGTAIKRLHLTELRTALDAARTQLSLSAVSYTDGTVTAGSTQIKKAHIDDLRSGVQ